MKRITKKTGEKEVFREIMEEREHVSFISGIWVPCITHNWAHVLAKGLNKYPKFKLHKPNIRFLTAREHDLYDKGTEDQRDKYADHMFSKRGIAVDWQKLYDLREELKEEYKQLKD